MEMLGISRGYISLLSSRQALPDVLILHPGVVVIM